MKQLNNDNAANRTSYVGYVYNVGEKTFKNVVNDIEFAKKNEYKINKTYVLIKELQNSLDLQDKEVFYMKYKNLLESINTL